jgi:hypothetical protein
MSAVAASAAKGGAGRSGEVEATLEVRLRMPVRALGGTIIPAPSTILFGGVRLGLHWLAPPWATVPSGTVLIPTVANPLELKSVLESGRRVIVDSDANVFASDVKHFLKADLAAVLATSVPRKESERWLAEYREMLRAADAVTVPTAALVDVYHEAGARHVFVVPNAIDPAHWAEPAKQRSVFTVGYAGGPGHDDCLELIRPALKWASGQPGVEAVLFGADNACRSIAGVSIVTVPPEWEFPCRRLEWTPSYDKYRSRLTGLLDVGLMPLTDGAYNRGRSDLKILEYAMSGALPIVQDCDNYAAWRGSPVLFARGADEFTAQVQWAVGHPAEVRERAAALRELVLRTRTIDQTIPMWRAALKPLRGDVDAGLSEDIAIRAC